VTCARRVGGIPYKEEERVGRAREKKKKKGRWIGVEGSINLDILTQKLTRPHDKIITQPSKQKVDSPNSCRKHDRQVERITCTRTRELLNGL
jgi:hypothetical protein